MGDVVTRTAMEQFFLNIQALDDVVVAQQATIEAQEITITNLTSRIQTLENQ